MAATVVLLLVRPWRAAPDALAPQVAPAPLEVLAVMEARAMLQAAADTRHRVAIRVEELIRQSRARARATRAPSLDPVLSARIELEIAAQTLMRKADRLAEAGGLQAAAADEYRRVLRLFPESRWAPRAQARLAELNAM